MTTVCISCESLKVYLYESADLFSAECAEEVAVPLSRAERLCLAKHTKALSRVAGVLTGEDRGGRYGGEHPQHQPSFHVSCPKRAK